MKRVKKIFKILGISALALFLLLLIAGWAVAYFYADDIKKMVGEQIAKTVNAEVNFSEKDLGLSLIRNFPNIAVYQGNLSVVGKDQFKGDTLFSAKNIKVVIDVWSLFSSQPQIRGIYVDSPRVLAKVLKNGKANWDIMIPTPEDTTKPKPTEEPTKFDVSIRWWEIDKGHIVYDDKSMGVFTKIENLNHSGSGNFNQDVFDLNTNTKVEKFRMDYGGISYMENKMLDVAMVLNMNLPESKYTFKENKIKINDFAFGFDGFVQMLKDKIAMDIKYKAQENEFKNILSLVPGMFANTAEFQKLKTSGTLAFDGFVKGNYAEKEMPGFGLNLQVDKGMFQYPDLPTAVNNVAVDLKIDNKSGVIEETVINLAKFHADLGKNPIDAKAKIEKLVNSLIDANVKAKIDLGDMSKMFPMEGLVLRGLYGLDATVNGVYNTALLPSVSATMSLANGYVKSNQFPEALESMNFLTTIKNSSGKYADTKINLQNFNMVLDKEAFSASGFVENLDDITYNFKGKGGIDLGKIVKLFPSYFTNMSLAGKIKADIATEGRMSYAMNGQYDKLPTSGFVNINNFAYSDKAYLPQGFKITSAQTDFTPKNIQLKQANGFLGQSDYAVTGSISNYIAYVFKGETLSGKMDFKSNKFVLDEWMPATTTPAPSTEAKTEAKPVATNSETKPASTPSYSQSSVVEIPKNIDFTLDSYIKEVKYDKIPIEEVKGLIIIRDGVVKMENINFNSLGGAFVTNGSYSAVDKYHPKYNFDFGIKSLPLSNAYSAFVETGKGLASKYTGKLNSLFKISGELGPDMMPLFDKTMSGQFKMDLLEGYIKDANLLKSVNSFLKLSEGDEIALKDVFMNAEIKEGMVNYKPFTVQTGDQKFDFTGGHSVDGMLNFELKTLIPKGKLTTIGKNLIAGLGGVKTESLDNQEVVFALTGPFWRPNMPPKILRVGNQSVANVKEAVKEKVKEKVEEKKKEVVDKGKEEARKKAEAALAEARKNADIIIAAAKEQSDKIKAEADAKYKEALDKAYSEAYNRAPIAKTKAGDLARQGADKVAKPIRDKAYQQADNLVAEAQRRADKMIADAQTKTNQLTN
jgi:uncharacterized protein involved in outer membrane biogenesis